MLKYQRDNDYFDLKIEKMRIFCKGSLFFVPLHRKFKEK